MWNDPHRKSTECWQKISGSERARKSPPNWIGQEWKERKWGRHWDMHPREGAIKEGSCTRGSHLTHGEISGTEEELQGSKNAAGVCSSRNGDRPAQTVSATTVHSSAWDARLPVREETGRWSSGFGDQTRGADWEWLCKSSLRGCESGVFTSEGVHRGSLGLLRGQVPFFGGGGTRGGGGPTIAALFPEHALKQQDTALMSSRSGCKLPPSRRSGRKLHWVSEVVMSHLCSQCVLWRCVWTATTIKNPRIWAPVATRVHPLSRG